MHSPFIEKSLMGYIKCLKIFYSYVVETLADRSYIIVEHRCCGEASPGSSPQRGYKSQPML